MSDVPEDQQQTEQQTERKPALLDRLIEKLSESRFFTISFVFHVLLIVIFGGTVMFEAMREPSDFEGGEGGFLQAGEEAATPPAAQAQPQETTFTVSTPTTQSTAVTAITTTGQNALDFSMDAVMMPATVVAPTTPAAAAPAAAPTVPGSGGMTAGVAKGIGEFSRGWGKGTGSGTGKRQREFEFTAFVGQYKGGNWNSTFRINQKNKIPMGALPNLLEFMSKESRDKIKTDYKRVEAIQLDTDRIFAVKPPFIFITGSRDFVLSDKEIENLQKYIRLGGAIWGDSSVPGKGSRFDIAFRREMKRVMPDKDKDFEELKPNDPMFTRDPYFTGIKEQPKGINYYQEPVYVMRYFGEIAIIYTANDYGDMWQFGVKQNGKDWVINTEADKEAGDHAYVALYQPLYDNAGIYIHNVKMSPPITGILDTYKFGTNMILHLLTRWEDKLRTAPRL